MVRNPLAKKSNKQLKEMYNWKYAGKYTKSEIRKEMRRRAKK